jgi:RHS repeat-associated protein
MHLSSAHSSSSKFSVPSNPLGILPYGLYIPVPGGVINGANGNLVRTEVDIHIESNGPPFLLARTYNSRSTHVGLFGIGWISNLEMHVQETSFSDLCFYDGDGAVVVLRQKSEQLPGELASSPSFYMEASRRGPDTAKLSFKDGSQLLFGPSGKLTEVQDRWGNCLTLRYEPGRITLIDALQRSCRLRFREGKVEEVCDFVGRIWTYFYEGNFLRAVRDPAEVDVQYAYSANQLARVFLTTEGKQIELYQFCYEDGCLVKVIAEQQITSLRYNVARRKVCLTDTAGAVTDFYTNENGNPDRIVENPDSWMRTSNQTTIFQYRDHQLLTVRDMATHPPPKAPTETYTYDERGNLKTIKNDAGITTFFYNKQNQCLFITEPDQQSTGYTYDFAGNLITCIDPDGRSDANEYDRFGNIITSTEALALGNNWLINACFAEPEPDNLVGAWRWIGERFGDQGGIERDERETRSGLCSIRLTPERESPKATKPGWLSFAQMVAIPVKYRGKKFTLSGEIKTDQLQNAQAFFHLEGQHEQHQPIPGVMVENRYSSITGTHDWTSRQLTLKTSPQTVYLKVVLLVYHEKGETKGCAWFDHLQLVRDKVAPSYNPLERDWRTFRCSVDKEMRDLIDDKEIIGDGISICFIRNRNDEPPLRLSRSNIHLQLPQLVPVTFTALCKTKQVKGKGANQCIQLQLLAYDDQPNKYEAIVSFLPGTHHWQRVCATIYPNRPQIQVSLFLSFQGRVTGTVWFSSPRLLFAGVCTRFTYDKDHFLPICVTDPQQQSIHLSYDQRGNLTEYRDEKGNCTAYSYDRMDRLQHVTDRVQHVADEPLLASYQYHALGLLSEKSLAHKDVKQTTHFTYDALFRLERITDASEHWIQFRYTHTGEVSQIQYSDGATLQYRYDKQGQLLEEKRDGRPRFQYEYDVHGNLTKIKDIRRWHPSSERKYSYDSDQNRTKLSSEDGTIQWVYKEGGCQGVRITNVNNVYLFLYQGHRLRDPSQHWYHLDYDENGDIVTLIQGNGSGASYTYTQGLLTHLSIGKKNGNLLEEWNVQYDAAENPIHIQDHAGREIFYSYDRNHQLMQELIQEPFPAKPYSVTYAYDPFGNRQQKRVMDHENVLKEYGYNYNILNQLILLTEFKTGKQIRYRYDERGNRVEDEKCTYHWNFANQLSEVQDKTNGKVIAEYLYDEQGRRIYSKIQGTTRFFIYDGDSTRVLYETNGWHQMLCYYTYDECGQRLSVTILPTLDEFFRRVGSGLGLTERGLPSGTYFYHSNQRGDVLAITNEVNDIVARYRYDAWGNVLEMSGIFAEINSYRYAGYRYDNETGLYYLIARYYDPQHGHFISRDPDPGELDDLLSQNGYTYAHNNPMTSVDPDGEARFRFGGGMRFGGGPRISNVRVGRAFRAGTRFRLSALPAGSKVRRGAPKGSGEKSSVAKKLSGGKFNPVRLYRGIRRQFRRARMWSYIRHWDEATKGSKVWNFYRHWKKHGRGLDGKYLNPRKYTKMALKFYKKNRQDGIPHVLQTQKEGLKFQGTPGGYFTKDGKIVTFWFKKKRW